MPKTRQSFWETKFKQNGERDERIRRELGLMGWSVVIVWECETRQSDQLADRLVRFLGPTRFPYALAVPDS